jgi:hypothetical protein
MSTSTRVRALVLGTVATAAVAVPSVAVGKSAFIDRFNQIDTIASTVPASGPAMGDQNPYGVAVVPRTVGKLVRGDVLVSNFNNSQNQQGTGSSIVEISPSGHVSVFAIVQQPTDTPAVGLTTALVALRNGDVVVGSLPAPMGMLSPTGSGALTILDPNGHVVKTLTGGDINGPWDMTAVDGGRNVVLFVTNVLNGTVAAGTTGTDQGTVIRIALRFHRHHAPTVVSNKVIASGFTEKTDPNALVIGPTGVGFGDDGVLYVADSNGNRIAAIPHALTRTNVLGGGGKTVSAGNGLMDPLGLTIAPNGDILSSNGGDGNLIETTPSGHQFAPKLLVANGAGDLFGIALAPDGQGVYFVNDAGSGPAANSLQLLHR